MPGKPRIEYAGAVYHVMNRGDQREPVFTDKSGVGACARRSKSANNGFRGLISGNPIHHIQAGGRDETRVSGVTSSLLTNDLNQAYLFLFFLSAYIVLVSGRRNGSEMIGQFRLKNETTGWHLSKVKT